MNLILIEEHDFLGSSKVARLHGRVHEHVIRVLKPLPGDTLRVGVINGLMGQGTVSQVAEDYTDIEVCLETDPPPPMEVTLVLALPRPPMLRRVLMSAAALGVKKIFLIHSERVEKSFWKSPVLHPDEIKRQLVLGLEQSCDTILPQVYLRERFKPFVEDEFPGLIKGTSAFVAHPEKGKPCPSALPSPAVLVVGPEGGFIPYEIEKLSASGAKVISLGPRVLRVETAVPVLLSKFL